jgi:DNA-directed RNA polymerase specialized sigma24 family protein
MSPSIVKLPPAPDLADACLMERVCAGDQRAFEMLVQRYQSGLSQFVSKHIGDEDAQDIVQGILL